MARALSQILTELDSVYNPRKDLYNKQISEIDPTMQAEEKGLQAQKEDSFNQITQGANRRGLLFSGIPLEEQARYTGSSYLPAVANLKAKYAQQKFNLQDALSKIGEEQYGQAYNMYNNELQQEEAARSRAAASAGSGVNFGGGGGGATGGYGMQRRRDGGFNFVDEYGNPVSAATYSGATGIPFTKLLQTMARQGDKGAQQALGFVGNDYGFDASKIGNNQGIYNSLIWGTNRQQAGAPLSSGGVAKGTLSGGLQTYGRL